MDTEGGTHDPNLGDFMPVYQPGIPTGTVNLDVDYLNLQGNFQQANIVYGQDHYPFDNATPNQGFHNLVTTPPVVNNPPDALPPATPVGICRFYAYQKYAAMGILQWSRGPNNALPTPLTNIYGGPVSIASLASANIMDFVGFTRVTCILSAFNDSATSNKNGVDAYVVYSQGTFNVTTGTPGSLSAGSSGTVLQLKNNTGGTLGSVYWALQFIRVE